MQKKDKLLIKNVLLNGKKNDIFCQNGIIQKIDKKISKKSDIVIDCKGEKSAIPGLINGHTHSAMSLLRGIGDDMPLKEWLEDRIWPIEEKLSSDDIYWGTKFACLEMIKNGILFYNEMYMFPEISMQASEKMGIRSVTGLVVMDVPKPKDVKEIEKKYQKIKETELSKISISPHSIYTVSKENLKWIVSFAKKNNLIIHIHVSETKDEVDFSIKNYKQKPINFLDSIGLLTKRTVMAHGVWIDDEEMEIIGKRKSSLIYNPTSNLKLAVGKIFPYDKAKKYKVNVALGTDGSASNNNLDLLEEMKIGSLIQKYIQNNPTALPAQEILDCATINGARAFGLNSGIISVGKNADIALINMKDISLIPGHNLVSDLAYSASGSVISDLICNGLPIMLNRKVENENRIISEFKKRSKNITK
ncbi:MAG: 5-methylthioadenosine/S-adenosylhomocysteine deaminase [Parcubacteria group bacterium ADurb.Bin247]|jgi:5-methylthioadenosine/S-adenosylhomocysteine deaminase|nr:MAG: 5-methylthioadenosine/S-adenosylhomocysteine deaminase [Parcubacteria group bacterium ADurb.Bin247]HQB18657.1 amidohydrolase [Candidatus Pacearchaeota archaeon]